MTSESREVYLNCKEQDLLDYVLDAYCEITHHNIDLNYLNKKEKKQYD